VKFTIRPAMALLLKDLHWKNIVLKARQLGTSTFIAIMFLDSCLFASDLRAGIVCHKLEAAQIIFRDKILYAYDHLPPELKKNITVIKRDGGELLLSNNSGLRVDTSMRSGTLQLIHISEFGAMCAHYPEKAKEVKTGTLETAHENSIIFVESTAEGSEGDFYDMCQTSIAHQGPLSWLDYRLHFFAWFDNPEYVLDPSVVSFTDADNSYFSTIESEAGVSLSAEQRAWYVKKKKTLGPDMLREYPSVPREAFSATDFSIFDSGVLDAIESECKPPRFKVIFDKADGKIKTIPTVDRILSVWNIWKRPEVNHQYAVYGDVMEGIMSDPNVPEKGHDRHFAGILDRNTNEVVGTYYSQQDTIPYARQLYQIGRAHV
jgi:hypothetical protein